MAFKPYGQYKTYKSGAQKGLEEKMSYWHERDFTTEYNIMIGQALNCALADINPDMELDDKIWLYFTKLMEKRTDPVYQKAFEEYHMEREEQKKRKVEKKEETKDRVIQDHDLDLLDPANFKPIDFNIEHNET